MINNVLTIHLLGQHLYGPLLCLQPARVLGLLGYQITYFLLPRFCQLEPVVCHCPTSQDDEVLMPYCMPAGWTHLKQIVIGAPHQTPMHSLRFSSD